MLHYWLTRRLLHGFRKRLQDLELQRTELFIIRNSHDSEREALLRTEINRLNNLIGQIETNLLRSKATRLGISIPKLDEWWKNYEAERVGASQDEITAIDNPYLTELGKAGTRKLIKEERRKNIEWWLKIFGSIIAPLTGLIGSIIGLIAFLKK